MEVILKVIQIEELNHFIDLLLINIDLQYDAIHLQMKKTFRRHFPLALDPRTLFLLHAWVGMINNDFT